MIELNKIYNVDYFKAQEERFAAHTAQTSKEGL
jgi:hypothetical protein